MLFRGNDFALNYDMDLTMIIIKILILIKESFRLTRLDPPRFSSISASVSVSDMSLNAENEKNKNRKSRKKIECE